MPRFPQSLLAPGQRPWRRAAVLSVLAALMWPWMAALVAWALGGLLTGAAPSPLLAALGFGGLGVLRALANALAEGQAQAAADAILTQARADLLATEARRAEDSRLGGAGSIAALAGEKLELLVPYITRYAPARARVSVLPLVILMLAFWHSWAVGLILLVAGPLIPVFMALVGMAAKEASARQLAEIGTLNDLLVDRLRASARVARGFRVARRGGWRWPA